MVFDTDKAREIGSGGHLFGMLLAALPEKKAGSEVMANTIGLRVAFALTVYGLDMPVAALKEHFSAGELGIQHRGFALIDVLQPCVSFNRKNTFVWYRDSIYNLGG